MAEALKPGDPRRAGPYELLERLGAGGMGQVYLGRSPGGRPVAIKVIRAELLAGQSDFRARFAREVAAAQLVGALFTAPVVDADPDADMPWLATAYVPGPSLADAVTDHGPMRADVLHSLAAGLAEGLAAIHKVGVVHRDLKPANVLLASDGPRIIDFGISRAVEASALTGTGLLVGTPAFMSPEQAESREVGAPSDVFSLGSVLTFAATGASPFRGGNALALLYQVVHAEPDIGAVPPQLRPLVQRCLAKDPAARPAPDQIIAELGPVGLLGDWLPQAVAETLHRYDVPGLSHEPAAAAALDAGRAAPPAAGRNAAATVDAGPHAGYRAPQTQQPGYQRPPGAGPYYQPPPSSPRLPAAQPYYQPPLTARPQYLPPPAAGGLVPAYWPPGRPYSGAGQRVSGPLPREYRFGWLSLPAMAFLAVATFVVPLETLYGLIWGFVATIVVSRAAAAVIWVRRRGTSGLTGLAIRSLLTDAAGAIGLSALAFAMLFLTVDVLLPALGHKYGNPADYRKAMNTGGPVDVFSHFSQAWFFLHLFLLPSVVAMALVVLLRSRANLGRPLVLPRAAKLLNGQASAVRLIVAGVLVVLALGLVGLNGGLTPTKRPSGAVCVVGPATCAAAKKLVAAHNR